MMHVPAIDLNQHEKIVQKTKARKSLLWLGIISIMMLFAAFTSGYIVRQGEGKWVQFDLPQLFIYSTITIVLSSIPMQWAVSSAKHNRQKNLKRALALTVLLGMAFVGLQFLAWSELFSKGITLVGHIRDLKGDYTYVRAGDETDAQIAAMGNVAGSFLFIIVWIHVVHLLAGIIALFRVFGRALKGKYS